MVSSKHFALLIYRNMYVVEQRKIELRQRKIGLDQCMG